MNCSLIKQQAQSIKFSIFINHCFISDLCKFELFTEMSMHIFAASKRRHAVGQQYLWNIFWKVWLNFSPLTVQNHKNIPVGAGFNISQSFLSTESRKNVKMCSLFCNHYLPRHVCMNSSLVTLPSAFLGQQKYILEKTVAHSPVHSSEYFLGSSFCWFRLRSHHAVDRLDNFGHLYYVNPSIAVHIVHSKGK